MDTNPELALAMSMQLGHKNPSTTFAYYLGSEQKAAGRKIDEIVKKFRSLPKHAKGKKR